MTETSTAIATFWEHWPELQAGLEKAIAARDAAAYGDLPARISTLVEAIDEGLQWELGPGERAEHCFTLSAAGDPELRVLAERWLASAPKDDPIFEHSASRRPRPGFAIQIEGYDVKPEDILVRTSVDEGRERIDVEVWHDAFAAMPESLRGNVAFLMLDGALGEDGVERWIGVVDLATSRPSDATPLPQLGEQVEALRATATGERWAVLRGERDGTPVFASLNRALKRVDHLLCSFRIDLVIQLRDPSPEGLPEKDELAAIAEGEDRLLEVLGEDVVFVGTLTHAGRRTLVFYAMESSPALARMEDFVRSVGWSADVTIEHDPTWQWLHDFG